MKWKIATIILAASLVIVSCEPDTVDASMTEEPFKMSYIDESSEGWNYNFYIYVSRISIYIIVSIRYIITADFSNPYIIPPTSLNCFINGICEIVSDKNLKNIITILITINKAIATKTSPAFVEIVSATTLMALFFASFVFSVIILYWTVVIAYCRDIHFIFSPCNRNHYNIVMLMDICVDYILLLVIKLIKIFFAY